MWRPPGWRGWCSRWRWCRPPPPGTPWRTPARSPGRWTSDWNGSSFSSTCLRASLAAWDSPYMFPNTPWREKWWAKDQLQVRINVGYTSTTIIILILIITMITSTMVAPTVRPLPALSWAAREKRRRCFTFKLPSIWSRREDDVIFCSDFSLETICCSSGQGGRMVIFLSDFSLKTICCPSGQGRNSQEKQVPLSKCLFVHLVS